MNKILEIACFNSESALAAAAAGADRIELCVDYSSGGITPPYATIAEAREKIKIPLHVIIRPRAGNFRYDKNEIKQLKSAVSFCKQQHINGIVFGCLNAVNEIEESYCKEIIELAKPMSVNFHRAIDSCENSEREIEKLVNLGVDRVLTSGGKTNVNEGKEILKQLQLKFGKQIIIMPGGGIRSCNIKSISETSQCKEYHSAAITNDSENCDVSEIKKLKQFLSAE